jgi:SAM-dependent methyltransferase
MKVLVLLFFFSFHSVARDHWQKPKLIFESITTGKDKRRTFCDIGAGEGYFTKKAIKRFKYVFASEIDSSSLEKLRSLKKTKKIKNLTIVDSKTSDPLFPKKCDIIFLSMVYHHLEDRIAYIKNLKKYLSPGGKIVNLDNVVDEKKYEGTGKRLPDKNCRFARDKFLTEVKKAGYQNIKEHKILPMQYLIEFW